MATWGKSGYIRHLKGLRELKSVPPYVELQVSNYVVNYFIAFAKRKYFFFTQKPDMFQYDYFCFDSEKHVGT